MITRKQIWGLVALTIMWGIYWPIMKLTLRELSPLYFRAVSMSLGSLLLYFYYRSRGINMMPHGKEWLDVLSLGTPNILALHAFSILGVNQLASGRAAILGYTMPIWTILISTFFLREKLTKRVCFATIMVFLAVGLLLFHEVTRLTGRPVGIAWMLSAAISWAIGTLMLRRATLTLPMEALTVWMMLTGSLGIWILAILNEPVPNLQFSFKVWSALIYSVVIIYGVSQMIWFGLARHLPSSTIAVSIMTVPLVGTLSSPLITGEIPHWQDYIAVGLVMLAIAAVLVPFSGSKAKS